MNAVTPVTDVPNPARPAAARLVPGLCSVTFRELDVPEVVGLIADAGLRAVEWGGDVHVPVGDLAAAERARTLCAEKGVDIASYGSYWRAEDGEGAEDFAPVVRTAAALGAPGIRVWAGSAGSAETSAEERAAVVRRLAAAADLAAEHSLVVSLEYHRNTLTDTPNSAELLLKEVAAERAARFGGSGSGSGSGAGPDAGAGVGTAAGAVPPLGCYWQPAWWRGADGIAPEDAVAELALLRPWLTSVHVFSWDTDGVKLPLAAKETLWREVFGALRRRGDGHYALLEFVAGDDPEVFREDAARFLALLDEAERTAAEADTAPQAAGRRG